MITKVAREKLKERRIMSWWVTIAVTVKVAGCAAEHGVLVRRQRRHWTPSFRGSSWSGRVIIGATPSGEDTIQSLTAPLLSSSDLHLVHLAPGTWHKTSVKSSDTLNCDPAKKKLCDH